MLHKNPAIISPKTLELIQELQKVPELEGFHLAGGTALALQLGHRNSIDIDLFTQKDFTADEIENAIKSKFSFEASVVKPNTVLGVVNNIKTDFIRHAYPYIVPPVTEEGITFLAKEDIAL